VIKMREIEEQTKEDADEEFEQTRIDEG